MRLVWDQTQCEYCFRCVIACPRSANALSFEKGYTVDESRCARCIACARACPRMAITIQGEERASKPDLWR